MCTTVVDDLLVLYNSIIADTRPACAHLTGASSEKNMTAHPHGHSYKFNKGTYNIIHYVNHISSNAGKYSNLNLCVFALQSTLI